MAFIPYRCQNIDDDGIVGAADLALLLDAWA